MILYRTKEVEEAYCSECGELASNLFVCYRCTTKKMCAEGKHKVVQNLSGVLKEAEDVECW